MIGMKTVRKFTHSRFLTDSLSYFKNNYLGIENYLTLSYKYTMIYGVLPFRYNITTFCIKLILF